jgi:basic membrane protein A
MKKMLGLIFLGILTLVGCSPKEEQLTIKVGMVTDSGSIDDKSFNQGSWEGILNFQAEHDNVEVQYIKPSGETLQDYTSAIDNLILAGNEVIVMPGFKFDETASVVAEEYPYTEFILIDAEPTKDGEPVAYDNVVSIFFKENEAGFLSGVTSALQTKTGKLGFIGGFNIHSVAKFGYGYVSGVAYANKYLGTDAYVTDYTYVGSFNDVNLGKSVSGGMFDKGVDIIHHASGVVGVGAISEAKTRSENGENVYVVGVDIDQYDEGVTSKGNSVILTSSMKRLDVAVKTQLENWLNGEFEGGKVIVMDYMQDGVGLPIENPNLTEATIETLKEVGKALGDGTVKVPSTVEELESFLNEYDYHVEGVQY